MRRLADEGLTAQRIAVELDRTSHSVVGRCHRLRIKLGVSRRNGTVPSSPFLSIEKLPFTPTTFECRAISMMDEAFKTAGVCKWPVNHVEDPRDHLFCGNATREGEAYCPSHMKRSRGSGTPAERRALYVLKKMADA